MHSLYYQAVYVFLCDRTTCYSVVCTYEKKERNIHKEFRAGVALDPDLEG